MSYTARGIEDAVCATEPMAQSVQPEDTAAGRGRRGLEVEEFEAWAPDESGLRVLRGEETDASSEVGT